MSFISRQFGDIISKHGARYMLVASGENSNRLRTPTWRKISPGDERAQPTALLKYTRRYNTSKTLGTQNMGVCDQLVCGDNPGIEDNVREIRIQTILPMVSGDDPNTGLVSVGFNILGLPDSRSAGTRSLKATSYDTLLGIAPVMVSDSIDGDERVKTLSWSIAGLPELKSRRRMPVSLSSNLRDDKWVLPNMQGTDPITVVEESDATRVSFDIASLPYA